MVNRPRYWLAWQALTIISDLMFTSNMEFRFYSYNAFNYIFYDYPLIQAGVLANFSTADQVIVYYDSQYGMDTVQKLIYWVGAWYGGQGSVPWTLLINHFGTLGVTITDTDMENIVGSVSILGQICLNIQVTIPNDPDLGQHGTSINTFFLEQIQWGSAKVLGNPQITISNIPIVKSIGEFDFDPIFTTQPEFGFYVANNGGSFDDLLSNSQV